MAYNFDKLKKDLVAVEGWLKKEYLSVRTGRATPAILDGIKVEAYGTKMPVDQIATVSSEGAKTLRITPWDLSQAKSIEKAIQDAGLGLSVSLDDKGIRVHFPDLSEERRNSLIKVCKSKLEDARVRVRNAREEVWEDIQNKEKAGQVSEDEKFRLKDQMQKHVDEANKKMDELEEKKEKEILDK